MKFRISLGAVLLLAAVVCSVDAIAEPTEFFPVAPCRTHDSRNPNGNGPPLQGWGTKHVRVRGKCGVPGDAKAVAVTLTAVRSAPGVPLPPGGVMMIYDRAASYPMAAISNLNFDAGISQIANSAIVPLSTNNYVTVVGGYNSTLYAHFLLEIVGYFR